MKMEEKKLIYFNHLFSELMLLVLFVVCLQKQIKTTNIYIPVK